MKRLSSDCGGSMIPNGDTAKEHLGSTRAWLAEATRSAHEALHHHPLFGALLSEQLTHFEYDACLRVLLSVFSEIEHSRKMLGILPDLTLKREIDALRDDLAGTGLPEAERMQGQYLTAPEVLGALYTAHGSAFGGQVIARHLAQSHPTVPIAYFGLSNLPARWRRLLARIEETGKDRPARRLLANGAHAAFCRVDQVAAEALANVVTPTQDSLANPDFDRRPTWQTF